MQADRPSKDGWKDVVWERHRYNERTVLKSGSYLNCFCPHCSESLMRDNKIHLETSASLSRSAGLLYAADLLGGWLGGIIGAVVLLPVLGLVGTGITAALLKVAGIIVLADQSYRYARGGSG